MANKLPWFTHDHNAHDDKFISDSMEKFGHFGYAAYFIVLELIHMEGVGDVLAISPSRLSLKLRSSQARVRLWADWSQSQGKLEADWGRTEVLLKIKKFRERQSNMKSKLISTSFQPNIKPIPTSPKKEKEKEKEKTDIAPTAHEPKIVKPKTPTQRIVEAYKMAKDVDREDKAWDKANFGRYSKAAVNLLACFGQDVEKCAAYIFLRAEDLNEKRLDWTLETITRHAFDGIGLPKKEDDHGHEIEPLGANRLPEPRRIGGVTSSRSLAGDALRSLELSAVRPDGVGDLDGPGTYQVRDDEDFS